MARNPTIGALSSAHSIDRVFDRFMWLGDADDLLQRIGIPRTRLRRIEDDDEVSAALETRRHAAVNTPWRIEGARARERTFLEKAIAPHVNVILEAAWQAVPYGYSVFEIVYAGPKDPANATPGRIGISRIISCPFEWFLRKPDGELIWADTRQPADPRKFVCTTHRGSLRQPLGQALLARAYWPWFFRSHGWRYWSRFLEQTAVPLLIGRTIGDKDEIIARLRAVTTGPVIGVGADDSVEAVDAGGGRNRFSDFEIACTRRIQRLVLGQTLTSGTDGGSGNRALGEVHDRVRDEKRKSDIRVIAATAQAVVDRLAALNGMSPENRFVMEDATGLERDRAERDEILARLGVRFTPRYMEEKYGLESDDFEIASGNAEGGRAMLSMSLTGAPAFTDGQARIEEAISELAGSTAQPVDPAAIASAIRGARDEADLIARLGVAMAGADDAAFRQVLERAMTAAEITGLIEAERRAEN